MNNVEIFSTKTRVCLQAGISLVEIMVAMTLSLILTLGVSQIYMSSKQSYRLQEAQSRLQESGRLALELLSDDIRQAGYLGCPSAGTNPPNEIALPMTGLAGVEHIAATAVTGYEASGNGWLPAHPANWIPVPQNAMTGTDVINIFYAHPCGGQVQALVPGMSANPTVNIAPANTCSINQSANCGGGSCSSGDILVLADCNYIEIFRADAVVGNAISIVGVAGNTRDHFNFNHNVDAEVMVMESHTYFIRSLNGEPSLYRDENANGASPQPIVEGVEDMQILYGLYTGLNCQEPYQYKTAADVGINNWQCVTAVRIDLTLRTTGDEGRNFTVSPTNPCTGAAIGDADHRLRRCFSTTINLRNRRS